MLVLALFLSFGLGAQASVDRTVLCAVVGPQGQRIVALEPDDFLVHEAGRAREVLDAHIADYPIVVIIDDSPANGDFEAIRKAAVDFVRRLGERPVAVGTLSSPDTLLATFDDSRDVRMRKMRALGPRGSAAPVQALQSVASAARRIRAAEAQFSAIVVLSAGPIGEPTVPGTGVLSEILASGATVHVIANRTSGVPALPDALREVSDQTHGRFTTIYSAASYQAAADRLADAIEGEMMVMYVVPPGTPVTNDIKIGVQVPGARVIGLGVR